MESFFLFSPFPGHCKFKVSFKLLAFWDPFKITTVSLWVKKTSQYLKTNFLMYLVLHLAFWHPFMYCCLVIEDYIILFSVCQAGCKFSSEGNWDWKMPLLNKNVNYVFGKSWSKSLILQYGTLHGPKRVFQQKMVLFFLTNKLFSWVNVNKYYSG